MWGVAPTLSIPGRFTLFGARKDSMSRSRQVSLPLNKAVFSVKVKCCNAHHTIALTDEGSLRLCNHQDDMDGVEGMLLLNP